MPRPQFTLRSLVVAMLVVTAFFGGIAVQRRLAQRQMEFDEFRCPWDGVYEVDLSRLSDERLQLSNEQE